MFMSKVVKKKITPKKMVKKNSIKGISKTVVKKPKNIWLNILANVNIVAFIATLIINYQAVNLPIGGMTTGQLSDLYPNLFTPAPITFSIRGLIYLALLGFVIRQMVDFSKKNSLWITKNVGIRFILASVANIAWIFARHYQQVFLSLLILIFFLVTMIMIAKRVKLWEKLWTRKEKLLVQIPFSIYLWWISVATIANAAAWLVHIQRAMRGMSPIFRTILVIIVATLLALMALWKKYNIIFALVVVRAFIGIIIKTLSAEIIYGQIIRVLGACIAVITAGIGRRLEKRKNN